MELSLLGIWSAGISLMVALAALRNVDVEEWRMPHTYGIRAEADPQTLMRILGLFAQRSIVPDQVSCRLAAEYLVIDIQADVGDDAVAEILLHKIREQVCVDKANLVAGGRT